MPQPNGVFTLPDSDLDKVFDADNITVHSYGLQYQNRKQNRNQIGQCEHTTPKCVVSERVFPLDKPAVTDV